jgi:tetratricopeptide (TPR) repeat protein
MSSEEAHEPRNWKVKKRDGSHLEPTNLDVLRHWVTSCQIEAEDLVINDDLADWIPASEVLQLFDLFEKRQPEARPRQERIEMAAQESVREKEREKEVEVPDCAYHAGRKATEICVGCGKFICEECRQRIEGKVYCGRCMAEKQVGAEPGGPVRQGAAAQIISGAPSSVSTSRLAIASFVFSIGALLALLATLLPGRSLLAAPATAFVAFVAALSAGLALSRIRLSGNVMRGRSVALAALISSCVVLVVSFVLVAVFTMKPRPAAEGGTGHVAGIEEETPGGRQEVGRQTTRRQRPPDLLEQTRKEHEANAKQLLEQVERYLGDGQFEQAVSTSKTILGLYPETETAAIIEKRLPLLEETLEEERAEAEAIRQQNEQLAQTRFEHALEMYSEGERVTAIDLLTSVVNGYPETDAARLARVEIAKIQKVIADQRMKKLDEEASQLARKADAHMESEAYTQAVTLYTEILNSYSNTPTATSVRPKLKDAELLANHPYEREFRKVREQLETETYESAIALLQDYLKKYPNSDRDKDVKLLLNENVTQKSIADSLYNFGRTYFEEEKYNLALGRYGKLLNEYPRSRWIAQAKEQYEESLEKLREQASR